MNVIIVNDYSYINGGAGEIAVSTALALAERGHEVIFFAAVDGDCSYFRNNKKITFVCTNQYDILSNPKRLSATVQGVWNFKAAKIFEELLNIKRTLNNRFYLLFKIPRGYTNICRGVVT